MSSLLRSQPLGTIGDLTPRGTVIGRERGTPSTVAPIGVKHSRVLVLLRRVRPKSIVAHLRKLPADQKPDQHAVALSSPGQRPAQPRRTMRTAPVATTMSNTLAFGSLCGWQGKQAPAPPDAQRPAPLELLQRRHGFSAATTGQPVFPRLGNFGSLGDPQRVTRFA
jgi:hypothetical protein